MDDRLRAVCALFMPSVREEGGVHAYDGTVSDLSPEGVRRALAALGGPAYADPAIESHVAAFEKFARVWFGDLEFHRWNPDVHLRNLNLMLYERRYAPAPERRSARNRHLALWPDAVDMAVRSLDRLSQPTAAALVSSARVLAAQIPVSEPDEQVAERARQAIGRLTAHLQRAARDGDPDPAIGEKHLAALMTSAESLPFDCDRMRATAVAEAGRLTEMLTVACRRISPRDEPRDTVAALLADRPRTDEEIIASAWSVTQDLLAFCRDRDLMPYHDGELEMGLDPDAQGLYLANMRFCAPEEAECESTYHLTPPDWSWPQAEIDEWLKKFCPAVIGAISAHEVAPGHFLHFRALRHVTGLPRRILQSYTFAEGWGHYAEEVCVEEGFRADDPRFEAGVCLEALARVVRLASSIGLHTGEMTVDDSARMFREVAYMPAPTARHEANRGLFDPMYGRYTWGKLVLRDARSRARQAWGSGYSLPRFHRGVLALGCPPIGLLGPALQDG
jgi:Bacterial protein of unknown function (DUF885)